MGCDRLGVWPCECAHEPQSMQNTISAGALTKKVPGSCSLKLMQSTCCAANGVLLNTEDCGHLRHSSGVGGLCRALGDRKSLLDLSSTLSPTLTWSLGGLAGG